MDTQAEDKLHKIPEITLPDTCPDPRTVMVVYLHAHIALVAVERTRRSQDPASWTELKLQSVAIYVVRKESEPGRVQTVS